MALAMTACGNNAAKTSQQTVQTEPKSQEPKVKFDADSAFAYVERQTKFGPRVPGSQASAQCGDWLVSKLKEFGATDIKEQRTQVTAYNGDKLNIRNISARINPDAERHVMLLAHWDSRPWADQDPDASLRQMPIDGANDGASGVGVILEIARQLTSIKSKTGVDILFVDAEDYGRRDDDGHDSEGEDSWALGTQYWVANPTIPLREIDYAVLLDMVGGKNAVFPREYYSQQYASYIVDKIWSSAAASGYDSRFVNDIGNPIVDDHIYLLKAGVPAIDIIESANPQTGTFNPTWHTLDDNINNIDKTTLQIVGQTLLNHLHH